MIVGGVKATVPLELKSARHNELVHAVREGGPFDVVFVGDSIMQTLNDNDYGQKFTALQKTWDAYLEPRLTLNLSHDSHRIEHLLWNLENGCVELCRRAGQLTRRLADNRYVFWLDVNGVFLRPDGRVDTSMLWDLLHPSPAGADAWVRAILPTLDRLIDEAEVEREIASSFPWLERFVRATCEWCHCLLCSKIGCARQRH